MASVRNLFTIFDFPKSDWRRPQQTDFVRLGNHFYSQANKMFDEISDFTQFLIYITIDRMVASSAPSHHQVKVGLKPVHVFSFRMK